MKPSKLREIEMSCTCFNLRKATRAVTAVFDDFLAASGLRGTQFTLLAALYQSETATVTRLSQALVMDRTTLTRNLKPLQDQGLVRVSPGEDRRTRALSLSAKGRRVFGKAVPLWEQAQKQVIASLGKTNWDGLMKHLHLTSERMNPY